MEIYIKKVRLRYVNRKNVLQLIQQRDLILPENPSGAVGRQFLREFSWRRGEGKMSHLGERNANIIPRYVVRVTWRSLFSNYIMLEVHTTWIPLPDTAGTYHDGIIKARNPEMMKM